MVGWLILFMVGSVQIWLVKSLLLPMISPGIREHLATTLNFVLAFSIVLVLLNFVGGYKGIAVHIQAFAAISTISSVICSTAWHFISQHVLPSRKSARFAAKYNVRRRHFESLSSWDARTDAVALLVLSAEKAFIAESSKRGTTRISDDGPVACLPANDPVALTLLHARYPDGPSIEELAEIAGYGIERFSGTPALTAPPPSRKVSVWERLRKPEL
jgi:hypothetical protein